GRGQRHARQAWVLLTKDLCESDRNGRGISPSVRLDDSFQPGVAIKLLYLWQHSGEWVRLQPRIVLDLAVMNTIQVLGPFCQVQRMKLRHHHLQHFKTGTTDRGQRDVRYEYVETLRGHAAHRLFGRHRNAGKPAVWDLRRALQPKSKVGDA